MTNLLAETGPLSLAAAISPLVLMGVLAILGGDHGRRRAAAYTLGVVVMTVVLVTAGLVLIEVRQQRPGGTALSSPVGDAVVGILLLAFAALLVRPTRAHDDARAAAHHRRLIGPNAPLLAFAGLGAVLMLSNVSTIVVLIAILKAVAEAGRPLADDVIAMALVVVVTTVPAWGPLAVATFGGPAMEARVTRLGVWTNRNGKYILAVLFAIFGLQDILKALGH